MKQKLQKSMGKFIQCFDYAPNYPERLDFDENEYAEFLDKCVEDKIDYTIEKYGTVPPKSFEPSTIFID